MILLTVSSNIQYSELFFRSINALTYSKYLEKILGALHPANIVNTRNTNKNTR